MGLTIKNAVSVAGNAIVKGFNTNVNMQAGSNLSVTGDLIWQGTDLLNVNASDASLSAKDMTLPSPRNISFVQTGVGQVVTLTGQLCATGRVIDIDMREAQISGSAKAKFVAWQGALDQTVNVISSLGSSTLALGGLAPLTVGGNIYVSSKLTTSTSLAGTFLQNVTVNGGIKEDSFGITTGTVQKNLKLILEGGMATDGIGVFGLPVVPEIFGNLNITTGNGNDLVGFRCHVVGTTTLFTGGGSNTIWMYQCTFDGQATINTGAGDDIFNLADAPFFDIPVTFHAKVTIDVGVGTGIDGWIDPT